MEPVNNDGVDDRSRTSGGARYVGMDSDGEKPTMEEGCGTMYSIRSFRNPQNDDALFREVIFDTRTRAAIQLKDNLSMFILQHYGSSSDLNERGEGYVQCCTEYHKTDVTTIER